MAVKIVDLPAHVLDVDYTEDVKAVDKSGKAGALDVPTEQVKQHKTRVRQAAKRLGRSAKFLSQDENDNGQTTLVFQVVDLITRPRKPKTETPDDTAAGALVGS